MNKQIKQMWINALRGNEYKQTQSYLRDKRGYCCLGVLCDIYRKQSIDRNVGWDMLEQDYYTFTYPERVGEAAITLPNIVKDWAEVYSVNPIIKLDDRTVTTLAELNDGGKDFKQIADIIDKYL